MNLDDSIIDEMKKRIKEHPVLKQHLEEGIEKYGLTEEEALETMIFAWADTRKNGGTYDQFEYDEEVGFTDLYLGGATLSNTEVVDKLNKLHQENLELKAEIVGMEALLKSYQATVKHDAELLADATRRGYLPPLKEECEEP